MIVSITGHRHERIPDMLATSVAMSKAFLETDTTLVIQGMAAGVDLMSAKMAYLNGIPFWCAKPWKTHRSRMGGSSGYTESWEYEYDKALQFAEKVIDVTDYIDYPGPYVYQIRNEWMVDHAEAVIAVWDGVEKGGTWNCVRYAKEQNKEIYRIHPVTLEAAWLPVE